MSKVKTELVKIEYELRSSSQLPLHSTVNGSSSRWVVYRGNPDAAVLVIGEAPGYHEAEQGKPFVGESGKLFDQLMSEVLGCEDVEQYMLITNCIMARPPHNRDPTALELDAYAVYLRRLVVAMHPRMVVAIGRIAATMIENGLDVNSMYGLPPNYKFSQSSNNLQQPSTMIKILKEEGKTRKVVLDNKVHCRAVYMTHPSFMLRMKNIAQRRTKEQLWVNRLRLALMDSVLGTVSALPQPCPEYRTETLQLPAEHPNYVNAASVENDLATSADLAYILKKVPDELPDRSNAFCGLLRDAEYDQLLNCFYMYLTTPDGKSARITMYDYEFSFYVNAHPAFRPHIVADELNEHFVNSLATTLTRELRSVATAKMGVVRGFRSTKNQLLTGKVRCEIAAQKRSHNGGMQPVARDYIRVTVSHHDLVYDCIKLLEAMVGDYDKNYEQQKRLWQRKGEDSSSSKVPHPKIYKQKFEIMEGNFSPVQYLTYQSRVRMSHWLLFAQNSLAYQLIRDPVSGASSSYGLQLSAELHGGTRQIVCLDPSQKVMLVEPNPYQLTSSDHAPLTRLACDIECANKEFHFPDPLCDPVTTISHTVHLKKPTTEYHPQTFVPLLEGDAKPQRVCKSEEQMSFELDWMAETHQVPDNDCSLLPQEVLDMIADDTLVSEVAEPMMERIRCAQANLRTKERLLVRARFVMRKRPSAQRRLKVSTLAEEVDTLRRYLAESQRDLEACERVIEDALQRVRTDYVEMSFQLGACSQKSAQVQGYRASRIYTFNSEAELLRAWHRFFRMVAPEQLTGHNLKRFDMTYLFKRMSVLGLNAAAMGLRDRSCLRVDLKRFMSRAYGERVITELQGLEGCTVVDTLEVYLREKKENSYRLDALAQKYLGCKKDDVPYAALWGLLVGSDSDRRRVVDYCVRDARLCDQLINKHSWDVNMSEFARVNGTVSESELYVRGQQIKVLSAVMQRNMREGHRILIATPSYWSCNQQEEVIESWLLTNEESKRDDNGVQSKQVATVEEIVDEFNNGTSQSRTDAKPLQATISSMFAPKRKRGDESAVAVAATALSKEQVDKAWKERKRGRPAAAAAPTTERQQVKQDLNMLSNTLVISQLESVFHSSKTPAIPELRSALRAATQQMSTQSLDLQPLHEVMKQFLSETSASYKVLAAALDKVVQRSCTEDAAAKILGQREVGYEGATVMEAVPGLHYKRPVICVDFSSLYPAIMQCWNVSPDTKLYESDFARLEKLGYPLTREQCWEAPVLGTNPRTKKREKLYFVKREHWHGILPATEEDLLAARGVAKKQMASVDSARFNKETGQWEKNPDYDPVQYGNYNGRQAQIKVVCNSMYGATGASGVLGDKDCAAAVTAWGRVSIQLVRRVLEERYNANCVGGDTDSVFMQFPGWDDEAVLTENQRQVVINTVAEAEAFSDELEAFINSHFRAPMNICYEKSMFPMLVLAKKRYCGVIHEKGKKGRFFSKGMETVRRDSLPFTKDTMSWVFDEILQVRGADETMEEYELRIEDAIELSCEYIRDRSRELLEGKVPVTKFIMSKQLSREVYASQNAPHLEVKRKMEQRGEDPPKLGERVPFVFVITSGKDPKGYEMAEHPEYAIRNELPIHYAHYMDKKFVKPVLRVMKHVLREKVAERIRKARSVNTMAGFRRYTGEISGKDLEREAERFIFNTRSRIAGRRIDVQQRYMNSNVIRKAHLDHEKKHTIARFVKDGSSESRIENFVRKHAVSGIGEAIQKERGELIELHQKSSAALKTCQRCVKQERVLCSSYDCNDYFPRVSTEGRLTNRLNHFERILTDIEDMAAPRTTNKES